MLVSIREDRELIQSTNGNPLKAQVEKGTGGGGSRQIGKDCFQMTPQERKQYEWYVKKV